jgi:hypothetical protein
MQSNSENNNHASSPDSTQKIVFLVWDREGIRASGISKHLGASLHFLSTSKLRHPSLFIKTLQILRKERPGIIICQSPPITCAFIAMVYKYLFAKRPKPAILIDAHTGAISRPGSKKVTRMIMKRASAIIVINKEQQTYLTQDYHITPVILEDPIPDFTDILASVQTDRGYKLEQRAAFNVAFISSFAYDEPLDMLFDAASKLPDICFYVTGEIKNANKKLLNKIPDNVVLTGFLEYRIYVDLLQKVDVIMDLTTDNTSVVAGAFEAVSLEQPLITSNWIPLKRYFDKGTIYTDNTSNEIRQAIITSMRKKEELSKEMHQLKIEKIKEWNEKISDLKTFLNKRA